MKYSNLYRRLKKLVIENDPAGLIDIGAPEDEYDGYYSEIISLAKGSRSSEEVYGHVVATFKRLGSLSDENCRRISEFLWREIKAE